jgi:hypothetical protein
MDGGSFRNRLKSTYNTGYELPHTGENYTLAAQNLRKHSAWKATAKGYEYLLTKIC